MRQHLKVLLTLFAAFQLMLYPLRADQVGYFVYSGGSGVSCPVSTHVPIQNCTGNQTGASAWTCTFGSALGAGHLLYIAFDSFATSTFTAPFTWTGDGSAGSIKTDTEVGNGNLTLLTGYSLSTTGGGTVITATVNSGSSNFVRGYGTEYTNAATAIDAADVGTTGTSSTATSLNVTTDCNGAFLIGSTANDMGSTVAAGSGYTLDAVSPATNGATEYKIQATAGSVNASFTFGSSADWNAHIVAFK